MSEYINNSQKRKEVLKGLIRDLHAGGDPNEIKARFQKLIQNVSAVEIAHMEQELIDEGLPVEEVKALCDVHVAVFQGGLEGETSPEMTPGHPVHTFKYENLALEQLLELLTETMQQLPDAQALARARVFAEQLAEVNKIYLRKENLLFPILERYGVKGPSSVMWSAHDDIRADIKALRAALDAGNVDEARSVFASVSEAIRQMFYKEEHILYPTSLKLLKESEWLAIRDQSDEIGYCLIRPGDQWQPKTQEAASIPQGSYGASVAAPVASASGQIELDTGVLSAQQVNLLLNALPVDVTFVDENDTVRYFTKGHGERVFVRTAEIIGRQVQNCHPPKSMALVNRILNDFRAGKRDVAEFWIQMQGKFIHIRYFALRDEGGAYRGCIEVTQDATSIRALQGERRLLDEA